MLEDSGEAGQALMEESAIEPDDVAAALLRAMDEEQFLVLPHPEVGPMYAGARGRPGPVAGRHATAEPLAARRDDGKARLMRAWQVSTLGEPADVMTLAEAPAPEARPGHVLVEVLATALNFPDVLMARGLLPGAPAAAVRARASRSAARVVAVGAGVDGCRVGDRVIGMPALPHGGLAERALLPARGAVRRAGALDDAEAAALTVAYQTAYVGLHPPGRRCGRGRPCWCTPPPAGWAPRPSRSARPSAPPSSGSWAARRRLDGRRAAGADQVIDRSQVDLVPAVKEVVGAAGVDVVFDPVGGARTTPRPR